MESKPDGGNLPSLNHSLTDPEYDRLASILASFHGENAMDMEEMDGFLASLICGPVAVAPSHYLDEIWDGESPFAVRSDFEEFLNLVVRHWNLIARTMASPDLVFAPWLAVNEGEKLPRGNRWARGFLRGISLYKESWNEIFDDDDKFANLIPILALVHENDPAPEMRSWPEHPDAELRERVLRGLSTATQWIYDYFRTRQTRKSQAAEAKNRRPTPKIGRNDPCYCGSGKKYKRCCGGLTIN